MKKIIILTLVIWSISCNDSVVKKAEVTDNQSPEVLAFESTKWKTKDGLDYLYRDDMLKDLMSKDEVRKLEMNGIIDLMGPPDRKDSSYLFYTISQKRLGLFPLHTKTLVINFYPDSTVQWMKIHE